MTFTLGFSPITEREYHADAHTPVPTLSSSLCRTIIQRSARHAWASSPRLNPDHISTDSQAFSFGRAVHSLALGAGGGVVEIPQDVLSAGGSIGTKAAREFIADAQASGATPLKSDDYRRVTLAAESCRAALTAERLILDPEDSERIAYAEVGGVICRAMFDNAPKSLPLLIDLKTTDDASPAAVIRAVERYGYDVQAQHYREVWHAITGEWRRFVFVFIEKSAPYQTALYELHDSPGNDADWMLAAAQKTAMGRRVWGECLASGEWPGYARGVTKLGARDFYTREWIDAAG